MKKFMERFIEAVRKYEELLSYAQGGFILPYHSGAGVHPAFSRISFAFSGL